MRSATAALAEYRGGLCLIAAGRPPEGICAFNWFTVHNAAPAPHVAPNTKCPETKLGITDENALQIDGFGFSVRRCPAGRHIRAPP